MLAHLTMFSDRPFGYTSLPEGPTQLMAYLGNASRQLLESLQGVRRIHPDLRKVRVGSRDYVWLPLQQQIGRFLSGFQ